MLFHKLSQRRGVENTEGSKQERAKSQKKSGLRPQQGDFRMGEIACCSDGCVVHFLWANELAQNEKELVEHI